MVLRGKVYPQVSSVPIFINESISTDTKAFKLLKGLSHCNSVLWPLKCPSSFITALENRCYWKLLQLQTSCEVRMDDATGAPKTKNGNGALRRALWAGRRGSAHSHRLCVCLCTPMSPPRQWGNDAMVRGKHKVTTSQVNSERTEPPEIFRNMPIF